jgi:diguanylate cyclase (GGDEF)-like protein/PAS domain S-box-containing protein
LGEEYCPPPSALIARRPVSGPSKVTRLPVGTVACATALYAVLYFVWEQSHWGSAAARNLIGNVAFMPLNLGVMTLFALASRQEILDAGVRRALRLLALGGAMVFTGNGISAWYVLALHSNPPVSWADLFYLSDSLLTLTALLSFPLARRTRMERVKFLLDAAMVLVGGGVAIWYFSVRPTAASQESSLVVTLLAFAYPLVSMLVLLGVTTVLLRRPIDGNRLAFRLVVTGLSVGVVADLTFNLVQLEQGGRSASWADGVFLICYVILIYGAELYWRRPVARQAVASVPFTRFQPISPLPYLAVATTYLLLLYVALRPWDDPISGLVIGALLVTGLVVLRQLLTVRENLRLLAEHAARQNEARFRSLVQHSSDVIIVTRADGTVRFVSPSATRVFGYDPTAVLRQTVPELLHPDDRDRASRFFREAALAPGVSGPVEWRFRQADGSWLHAEILATNLLHDTSVKGVVLNTRDVSERRRLEEQLTHQAFHDPLTGLANRALFRDRVSHALALAQRRGTPVTVLFLDLDDFKTVNDSLGHGEGDRLLIAVAERFLACARTADTVARLGGDEFAILIEGAEGREGLPERLAAAMSHPFTLSGNQVRVTASIGVASASADDSADDLLRNADMAMYAAKRHGKGRAETYESRMYADIRERLDLEAALRTAIEGHELTLFYQPIVNLQSGAIYGVEALLRWEHPQFGRLLPQHFVPLAEETGLIVQLGAWVLAEACRQLQVWRAAYPELALAVSVNISGRQLQGLGLADALRQTLTSSGVEPSSVVLEITESVLMQETDPVLERLQQLKSFGVRLAIDDFGTGYSSLSYLQRFPIDILKIAKPFVEEVGQGADRSALARAIVGLGDTLKLQTIAEGIERAEQRAALIGLGCTLGQGHHFWPALSATAIEELLAAERLPRLRLVEGSA